jgi:hypothetical protein
MITDNIVVTIDNKVTLGSSYFPKDNLYEAFAKADQMARPRQVQFQLEAQLWGFVVDCPFVYVDQINGMYHMYLSKEGHQRSARLLLVSSDDIAFIKQAASHVEDMFSSVSEIVYTEECFQ